MSGKLDGKAARSFKNIHYFKFAATVDSHGNPNVVPLLSARMVDPETIAFVRFMVWKTRQNMESNKKITVGCTGVGSAAYLAKCEFEEWVSQGPLLEEFENEALYRYNAYSGANELGILKVREVLTFPSGSLVRPILASFASRLVKKGPAASPVAASGSNGARMPHQVVEKWSRPLSIRFLGMIDEKGDPLAVPCQDLSAPDANTLAFPMPSDNRNPLSSLKPGARLAASVLALDPVAYQVKGSFTGVETLKGKPMGMIDVSEVFTAAPPVPGRRIYPKET